MNNELLVKTVRDLCKKNNIPVSKLETDLNFGAGLISRWVKSSPSIDKIIDIADYFHISLDEVTGYKINVEDEFLGILCDRTDDGTIQWALGTTLVDQGYQVKLWDKEKDEHGLIPDDYVQSIYATRYKRGYIIIYSYYAIDNLVHPIELILFIQPSDDSYLVSQHYTTDELRSLWTKVLYSLGDAAPDTIKAEELKNGFVTAYKNGVVRI